MFLKVVLSFLSVGKINVVILTVPNAVAGFLLFVAFFFLFCYGEKKDSIEYIALRHH